MAIDPVAGNAPAQKAEPAENEKPVPPPEPPMRIIDKANGWKYIRVGFLGQGGFARVYEVQNQDGARKAIKVVNKSSIKTKKNKTKLWAEIKLHQMLGHPNIVRFEDCFEDEENVYMVLELCENGSLMDLLRRRKRYSEPEARHILVQLVAACQYMHRTNVIHRDLKLGNLFFDQDMNVKVGDFGLAALIEKPGDRKKTICGTPNYIAPEVLFDTANGHSFEVDVWSVGVILYTLVVGRPPFQTKDVKAIYKRIRENRYEFPADKHISTPVKELIMSILNPDPNTRPTLDAILKHRWFLDGEFPSHIPTSAMDAEPLPRSITPSQSRRNFALVCQAAKIGVDLPIITEATRTRTALGPSIMQQERDFKNAVQPDSPISALLNSARQPLVQAPGQIKETSLLRKLTAAGAHATLSPARRGAAKSGRRMEVLGEEAEEEAENEAPDAGGYDAGVRQRELATQKARIVSQMTARERIPERSSPRKAPSTGLSPARTVLSTRAPRQEPMRMKDSKEGASLFNTCAHNLDLAMSQGQDFRAPHIGENPQAPKVFVVSWLDYCTKYGMGFAMTDGTISVHFNDSSSLALAPSKQHFDHIQQTSAGDYQNGYRSNYPIDSYPRELQNKVYLLKNFESYILQRLMGDHEYTYEDTGLTKGMVFIMRYLRMKHVIVFRLSNDVLQFNFYDHTKLILSQDGLVVSVIDRHYILRTWSLEALLQPVDEDASPKDKRRIEGVIHKLQYAKDVLLKIRTHALTSSKASKAPAPETYVAPAKEIKEAKEYRDVRETREPKTSRDPREVRQMRPIR